jgi:hypothetical protein
MKKLFMILALTGMVASVSALSLPQDDKNKAKETVAATKTNDGKACSNEKASCCKKDTKTCSSNEKANAKSCCKEKKTEQSAK